MASYTAPTTRTTGELISAAIFNTDLVENIKYFKDAPGFTGNVTVAGTLVVTGATTLSSATYTTSIKSTTALATPSALSATQATEFASTVSGASLMGFGTTNDVSLMNRAGTVCLGIGPNTTAVNIPGALSVTGAISSATSVALTGTTNNLGTITSGVWNAGAVTSSGLITSSAASLGVGVDIVTTGTGDAAALQIRRTAGTTAAWQFYIPTASTAMNFYNTANGTVMSLSSAGLLTVVDLTVTKSGTPTILATNTLANSVNNRADVVWQSYDSSNVQRTVYAELNAGNGLNFSGAPSAYSFDSSVNITAGAVGSGVAGSFGTSSTNTNVENVILNRTGSDGVVLSFTKSGVEKGKVSFSGATTTYATSSDARLKRELGIVTQTDVLRQTVIRDFEWIEDDKQARGVFAQEAYLVAPFAVLVGVDDVNAEGHLIRPWGVDYSKYVPDLIVGWQQHDATIQQLAARIAALEATP